MSRREAARKGERAAAAATTPAFAATVSAPAAAAGISPPVFTAYPVSVGAVAAGRRHCPQTSLLFGLHDGLVSGAFGVVPESDGTVVRARHKLGPLAWMPTSGVQHGDVSSRFCGVRQVHVACTLETMAEWTKLRQILTASSVIRLSGAKCQLFHFYFLEIRYVNKVAGGCIPNAPKCHLQILSNAYQKEYF